MNTLTAIERLACETALKKMLEQNYFDICTIDGILKVTRTVPDGRAYRALHLLHCVHYKDMPRELLDALPDLMTQVLSGPLVAMPGFNIASDSATGRPRLVNVPLLGKAKP